MELLAKAELILNLLETNRDVVIANHTEWLAEGFMHLETHPELVSIINAAMERKTNETRQIVAQLEERIGHAKLAIELLTLY